MFPRHDSDLPGHTPKGEQLTVDDTRPPRWLCRWVATGYRRLLIGERGCYWLRWDPKAERPILVYPGEVDRPPRAANPHFSISRNGAAREYAHPDGPSSTPYYVMRGRRVYPAEGHPDSDGVARYFVRPLPPRRRPLPRVLRNPKYGGSP